MNNILLSAMAAGRTEQMEAGSNNAENTLFRKHQLSNGMEVFDFDENIIIAKMERMMQLLDESL